MYRDQYEGYWSFWYRQRGSMNCVISFRPGGLLSKDTKVACANRSLYWIITVCTTFCTCYPCILILLIFAICRINQSRILVNTSTSMTRQEMWLYYNSIVVWFIFSSNSILFGSFRLINNNWVQHCLLDQRPMKLIWLDLHFSNEWIS